MPAGDWDRKAADRPSERMNKMWQTIGVRDKIAQTGY